MINTQRGNPGFTGCNMNDRAKYWLVLCVCVCVCIHVFLSVHRCASEPGWHCVRKGVKVRPPGD